MITIDKITVAVGKMAEMVDFYSRVFGVTLQPVEMFGATLFAGALGEVELLFCPKKIAGVEANSNTIQLRFIVDDVEAAYKKAVESGGKLIFDLQEHEGRQQCAFRDPDGNSFELVAAEKR
mgnify:CR=1 FL=1